MLLVPKMEMIYKMYCCKKTKVLSKDLMHLQSSKTRYKQDLSAFSTTSMLK